MPAFDNHLSGRETDPVPIREVTDGVFQLNLGRINAWLFNHEGQRVLVDTGVPAPGRRDRSEETELCSLFHTQVSFSRKRSNTWNLLY